MRVVCPSCDAAYDVPEPIVAARRRMRCARCATEFVASDADAPPEPLNVAPEAPPQRSVWREAAAAPGEEAALPPVTPGDLRIDETERLVPPGGGEPVSRLRIAAVLAAWALSLALLAAVCWGLVTFRERIMQAWPPSTRIYAAMGYLKR